MVKFVRLLAALVALSIASISFAQETPYTQWVSCLYDRAEQLDSPGEPADVVAEGAIGMCGREQDVVWQDHLRRAVALGLSPYDPDVARLFREHVANTKRTLIARILQMRAAKRR